MSALAPMPARVAAVQFVARLVAIARNDWGWIDRDAARAHFVSSPVGGLGDAGFVGLGLCGVGVDGDRDAGTVYVTPVGDGAESHAFPFRDLWNACWAGYRQPVLFG